LVISINMENLILNHTYLVQYGKNGVLQSITIILVTDKAYHIRWNRCFKTTTSWLLKYDMHNAYILVEDISKLIPPDISNLDLLQMNICSECNGSGNILDSSSTAGYKICPVCLGNKNVWKK
jgi:hypothetical protein